MIERISFGQVALAAIYASPLMAIPMVADSNNWFLGDRPIRIAGPFIVNALLLCIPAAVSNVVARSLVGWFASGLSDTGFHIAVGLLAGALMIGIVDLVGRSTAQIGGRPLDLRILFALMLAALCNAGMVWSVWHFGWKSAVD